MRLWFVLWLVLPLGLNAQRINHAGRILGNAPVVATATLFNTPEADAIVSQLQILPVDNAWNEDISRRPLLPNSMAMVSQIVAGPQSTMQSVQAPTARSPSAQPIGLGYGPHESVSPSGAPPGRNHVPD